MSCSSVLHLLGDIGNDGFGACLEDYFFLDEGRDRVGGRATGALLLCFHGFLVVVVVVVRATTGTVGMARVLGEDGEGFLQFDDLPIQNVMPYNEHGHALVEESRRIQGKEGTQQCRGDTD